LCHDCKGWLRIFWKGKNNIAGISTEYEFFAQLLRCH
jgi:hypothetical protein